MITKILSDTPENILAAAHALLSGELVSFPTETVYGLGAIARDEAAVTRVFAAKERPAFDPLIVHIQIPDFEGVNFEMAWSTEPLDYLNELNLIDSSRLSALSIARVNLLARKFWPGPLTMILPRAGGVSDLITSGLDTVAIRMPRHLLTQKLLLALGTPLVGPSANRFGRISPTTANDVMMELEGRLPYILDGGRASVGVESTVLFIEPDGRVRLMRPGGLSPEEISVVIGAELESRDGLSTSSAPGLLKNHYAPRKPMLLLPRNVESMSLEDWDFLRGEISTMEQEHGTFESLAFLGICGKSADKIKILSGHVERRISVAKILSESGSLAEAAHLLFGSLRVLDLSPADCILAEPCAPTTGLSWAIHDRLSKAASR